MQEPRGPSTRAADAGVAARSQRLRCWAEAHTCAPEQRTIGHEDLAALLHVHPATLRRMARLGSFPVPRLSLTSRPLYARALVEEWLLDGETTFALQPEDYRLLTTSEAARVVGVSRATAYRVLAAAVVPVVVGVEVRFPACRVRALLGSTT